VLLVEDHAKLARTVATGLRREQMAVDVALDGEEALHKATVTEYDVVLLDRDLPGVDGDEVCRSLTGRGYPARILMLTAAGAIGDRVSGLNIGADDYLAKPFAFAELVARIRALGRRVQPAQPPVLSHYGIRLDPANHVATRGGARLTLTGREFAVLGYLLAAQGRPVPAEELLEKLWDETTDPFTTIVKVTIKRLRTKLGEPAVIETVPRVGYRIGMPDVGS
jgi:DNA-binding response OmpR family regulator